MSRQDVFNEFLALVERHRVDLLDEARQQQYALLPSFGDWLQTNFPKFSWGSRLAMNLADDVREYFEAER
jgi:hypothetical protein